MYLFPEKKNNRGGGIATIAYMYPKIHSRVQCKSRKTSKTSLKHIACTLKWLFDFHCACLVFFFSLCKGSKKGRNGTKY